MNMYDVLVRHVYKKVFGFDCDLMVWYLAVGCPRSQLSWRKQTHLGVKIYIGIHFSGEIDSHYFAWSPLHINALLGCFFAYNQSCLLNFFQFICPWYWTVNRTSLLMEKSWVESKKLASFNITTTESHSFCCKYF